MAIIIKDAPAGVSNSFKSFAEEYIDPRVTQQSDDGTILRTATRSGRNAKFTASIVIKSSDWPKYRDWFWETCSGGLYPTRVKSYNGGETFVVGFSKPPTVSHNIDGSSSVNFEFYQNASWKSLT